jgi:hypothetical protein
VRLYYYLFYFLIFLYLTLGGYIFTIGGLPLIGKGTYYELFFFTLLFIGFLGRNIKYYKLKSIPVSKLLVVFFFYFLIVTLRNIISADTFSSKMSYMRQYPFIFTFIIIVSVPNPSLAIKRIINIYLFSAIIISAAAIFIQLTGVHLTGLSIDQFERNNRLIWGQPSVVMVGSLIVLSTYGYKGVHLLSKRMIILFVIISSITLFLTQSRLLIIVFAIVLVIWLKNNKNIGRAKYNIFFIMFIGVSLFLYYSNTTDMILTRFMQFEKESNLSNRQMLDRRANIDDLGRLGPLILSLRSNSGLQILFGKGYDPGYLSTSIHLHSGFGYVYSVSGILGILIVYGLLIIIILRYRKFLKENDIVCYEKEVMTILIYLLILRIPLSLSVGNLIQDSMISWGVSFGLLELCRRSIIQKTIYNKSILKENIVNGI